MIAGERRVKRRVWLGLGFAALVVGVWVVWTERNRSVAIAQRTETEPFVSVAGTGADAQSQLLREKSELLDPTPLFFPTDRNFGQKLVPQDRARQLGQVFPSFDAKLVLSANDRRVFGQDAPAVPDKLTDLLASGNEAPFAGLGEVERDTSMLPVRAGFIQVTEIKSGDIVIAQSLAGINPPRSDAGPVEFLAVVSSGGLVGDPFLVSGSEWDETDAFLRNYIVKVYRLGERLPPGRYRVSIGA